MATACEPSTALWILLDALADVRQPQELGALSRRVGLHPSTALRMLATLQSRRLVRESREGWLLGAHAFELGSSFVRGNSIWSGGSAVVERLALESEETSSLGILEHGDVLYIAIGHAQRELGDRVLAGHASPCSCHGAWQGPAGCAAVVGGRGVAAHTPARPAHPEHHHDHASDAPRTRDRG